MNNLLRCQKCGKWYKSSGLPKECCPACETEEETVYKRVRSFMWDHPGMNAAEIAEKTNVPFIKILKYVKEGLLEITPDNERGERRN